MPGLRIATAARVKTATATRTGKAKTAKPIQAKSSRPGCGTGAGGFKPGNTCGKGSRAKLAEDIKHARRVGPESADRAALRDKVRAMKAHRRGHEGAVDDNAALHLRASLGRTKLAQSKTDTIRTAKAEVRAAHAIQRRDNIRAAAEKPIHEFARPEGGMIEYYRFNEKNILKDRDNDIKTIAEKGAEYEAAKKEWVRLQEKTWNGDTARSRKIFETKLKAHEPKYQALHDEVGGAKYRIEHGIYDRRLQTNKNDLDLAISEHNRKGPIRVEYAKNLANHPDLLPPGPIVDRIKNYRVGDAKIDAIKKIDNHYINEDSRLSIERTKLNKEMNDKIGEQIKHVNADPELSQATHDKVDAIQKEVDRLDAQERAAWDQQKSLRQRKLNDIGEILTVDRPVDFQSRDILPGTATKDGPLSKLGRENTDKVLEAQEFLRRTVARSDTSNISVRFGEGPSYRAHYHQNSDPDKVHIQLASDEDISTIVHEYGHAIDHQSKIGGQSVNERSQEFLRHRVGDEKTIDMHDRFKTGDPGEMGRKDRFEDAMGSEYRAYYTGKDYGSGSSEITSMGMEALHRDPLKFVKSDREYAKFVLGIMDGSLR